MPTPGVTLKLKKFRRRFGITAPRVVVRSHVGWQWYAAGLMMLAAMVTLVTWSLMQEGEAAELKQEVVALRQQMSVLEEELLGLRTSAATEQSVVQMERSAQSQLVARIKVLERENAGLKEDVSVFERLIKDCPRKTGMGKRF